MQDRPTAEELLAAVRAFLEDEVVPALDGSRRFHARVAANVLAIVARELDGEDARLRAEWVGLAALLGRDAAASPGGRTAVREATEELAARIRRGDADAGPLRDAVRAHVRAVVREKLRVANPRFAAS